MNPFGHVWDVLRIRRKVRGRISRIANMEGLKIDLVTEWNSLPQETIDGIIQNMPDRIQAVIRVRGNNTRY